MLNKSEILDAVIIGAGPAGIAAAIQLNRYKLKFGLIEKKRPGGLLQNANLVENYPGFSAGITGEKLSQLMVRQLSNSGINIINQKVIKIKFIEDNFHIVTNESEYYSKYLVVASGTKPLIIDELDIPQKAVDKVFYEITSLKKEKSKVIAIIGSGDAAFDYAMTLSENNYIKILNRSSKTKALPNLREKVLNCTQIEYIRNISVRYIRPLNDRLLLICNNQEGEVYFSVHYLVIAIGREPELSFLSDDLKLLLNDSKENKRIFFIGDVVNGIFRQTAISVGDGVKAAMEIYFSINNQK